MEEGTRFVGIDLGKRSYAPRLTGGNGSITGWRGGTTPEGRAELYKRLRATDKIAIEARGMALIMNKEFKERAGGGLYILNPNKLFQTCMTDTRRKQARCA